MRRRGSWRAGFGQRFGRYDSKLKQAITNRHTIWLHAVSVGEVNVCTQLIAALEPRLPNLKIVVSTTTTTGMQRLQELLPNHVSKIYYPIDLRSFVTRALAIINPEAVVLIEAELWPNFLWRVGELRLPLFLVNARLSERSFRGYKRFGFLFRRLFASFTGVGVQNENDAARLRELGCKPEALHVVGSLKFDAAALNEQKRLDVRGMFRQLGVADDALILVGGSTHDGEEAILADVFLRLRKKHPRLFLIVVPRHFERGKQVGRVLGGRGLKFAYRSEVSGHTQYPAGELDCLLVNTTGELPFFYEKAEVIFVGKSLTASGGQNPIEPGRLGKAMVFGPNMQNFADIARAFTSKEGAIQVRDEADLEQSIDHLLSDNQARARLGQNGLAVVNENLGAINRTVDMIVKQLEDGEIFVAPARSSSLRT